MLEFISKLFSWSSKKEALPAMQETPVKEEEPAQETPVEQPTEEKPKEEPYKFDLNQLCEKIDNTAKTAEEKKREAEENRVNHIKSLAQEFLNRWDLFYAKHRNDFHELLEIADHLEKSKLILVKYQDSISVDTDNLTLGLCLEERYSNGACLFRRTYVYIFLNEGKYSLRILPDKEKSEITCKVHFLGTMLCSLYEPNEDVESYFNRTEFLSNPYNREGPPSCEAYLKLIKYLENDFDTLKEKLCKKIEAKVGQHQE